MIKLANKAQLIEVLKRKNVVLIAVAAVVLFVGAGSIAYIALRSLSQKDMATNQKNEQAKSDKEQLTKQAEEYYNNGDEALKNGDGKKGIAELKKALEIYEKNGDVIMAEQTKDQIAMAEFSLNADPEAEEAGPIEDQGKTNTPAN